MSTALILGAALWPGGRPSPTLARRTAHGAALYHAGGVARLICCGGLGRHGPAEAEVMAGLLRAAGVPETAIGLEAGSATTRENIGLALRHFPEIAHRPVVIVTDRYHAPRARIIARALGLKVRADCPAHRAGARAVLREGAALLKTAWWIARGAPAP